MSKHPKTERAALVGFTLWLLLLSAPLAFSATHVLGERKSGQYPQITVDVHGMPIEGASVEVYRGMFDPYGDHPTKPLMILTSDPNGQVAFPKLPYGRYFIVGRSKPDRVGYLSLLISRSGPKRPNLILRLDPARGSAEQVLESVQSWTHVPSLSAFRGTVTDAIGMPVPNAKIDIFAKEKGIDQQATHLVVGPDGAFSADIPEGKYVVYAEGSAGDAIKPVEISKAATSEGLEIELLPGETN